VFHAATGGFSYETLPLAGSAPDGVERYFVTDEVYTGRLTAWHADADPFKVTFWVIVSWTWQLEGGGSYWTVTGAATGYSGGTLLAFAVSLSPDPQQQERKKLRVKVRYRDSKGREWEVEVEYESVKTPPPGSITVGAVVFDAENGDYSLIGVSGDIFRLSAPQKNSPVNTLIERVMQLPPADDYTAEATYRTSPRSGDSTCSPPLKSSPEKFSVVANASGSIGFIFVRHKGIRGWVWERTSDGGLTPLPEATVAVFKGAQSEPIFSTKSEDNGSFLIPGYIVDGWLNKYGDGSFTIKVTPPARSMLRPDPPFILKDTPTITKCQRRKSEEPCPRDKTIDLGDFVFTYKPPESPPGGG
jgi:hypothetical protein